MVAMTRRLHMGCGETLQSHLPDSFRKAALVAATKQAQPASKQIPTDKQGKFWK